MRAPILAAAAILAGGCGTQELDDELSVQGAPGRPPVVVEGGGAPVPVAREQVPERCDPSRETRLGTARVAYAVRARGPVAAFRRPGGQRLRVFQRQNQNGVTSVFGVLAAVRDRDCRAAWYRVQLPIRPNGATGYVRADRVRLFTVRTRIEVDLSERRIDFFRNGRRVLRTRRRSGSPGHRRRSAVTTSTSACSQATPPAPSAQVPSGSAPSRPSSPAGRREARSRPRDEQPLLHRNGRLVRLPPHREPPRAPDALREPGGHSGRHPEVAPARGALTVSAFGC